MPSLVGSEMCIRDSQECRESIPASGGKPASKYPATKQWPQEHRLQRHFQEAPSSPMRCPDSPTSGRDHRPPSPDHGRQGQQQSPEHSLMSPPKKEGSQSTNCSQVTSPQTTPSPPWRHSKSATLSPPTASQSYEAEKKILKKEDYCSNKKLKKDSNKFRKIFYLNSF